MTAAFSVYLDTGGTAGSPGTSTDVDALGPPCIRFKQADNPTIDAVNPIPITASTTVYSYWKSLYLKCDTAPSTQVDNIKFYTDGTGFGTGITLNVADEMPTHNSGATTGYVPAASAVSMITNYTGVTAVTSAFSYNSGSAKTITISEAGAIINAQNETTDYVILQMVVIDTASPGDLANETLTFQYDEI